MVQQFCKLRGPPFCGIISTPSLIESWALGMLGTQIYTPSQVVGSEFNSHGALLTPWSKLVLPALSSYLGVGSPLVSQYCKKVDFPL